MAARVWAWLVFAVRRGRVGWGRVGRRGVGEADAPLGGGGPGRVWCVGVWLAAASGDVTWGRGRPAGGRTGPGQTVRSGR